MGAAFQGQTYPATIEHSAFEEPRQDSLRSSLHNEEPSMQIYARPAARRVQMPDFIDDSIDLHRTRVPEQQHPEVREEASDQGQATHMESQVQSFSDEPHLPRLLGRRMDPQEPSARTLPNLRSSEERLLLRRRRRAQTATITSSQMLTEALASAEEEEHVLRPSRVILTTPEGVHSMCLPQDRESRMHYVQAGLPAGPLLPEKESCAVCLEEFQTGDRVQLMANCRHVFHATCIKKLLLRSQMSGHLMGDYNTPCPLCRGPLVAASVLQIPRRERPRAITLNSTWFSKEMQNVEENAEDGDEITSSEDGSTKPTCYDPTNQPRSASLRRAGTAPLEQPDNTSSLNLQRAASSHLEALSN